MTLTQAKELAEIAGVVIALVTLVKGVVEYIKQGAQKRTELFLKMRDRYDKFVGLCSLLAHRDSAAAENEIRRLPFDIKREFLALYEEIALMTNSGLIRRNVAHYVFGYHAIQCWKCDAFWEDPLFDRESPYWGLFRNFAEEMEAIEGSFNAKTTDFSSFKL